MQENEKEDKIWAPSEQYLLTRNKLETDEIRAMITLEENKIFGCFSYFTQGKKFDYLEGAVSKIDIFSCIVQELIDSEFITFTFKFVERADGK